jgi:hypothetical protein
MSLKFYIRDRSYISKATGEPVSLFEVVARTNGFLVCGLGSSSGLGSYFNTLEEARKHYPTAVLKKSKAFSSEAMSG